MTGAPAGAVGRTGLGLEDDRDGRAPREGEVIGSIPIEGIGEIMIKTGVFLMVIGFGTMYSPFLFDEPVWFIPLLVVGGLACYITGICMVLWK